MKDNLVLPGDFLSTEEEFSPGRNAFECEGNICSNAAGSVVQDLKAKEISVKPVKQLNQLHEGSFVFGRVSLVKENCVNIDLCENPEASEKLIISQGSAMLPIRNVSRDYVEKLRDCFRVGDIVKTRITRMMPSAIDVATSDFDLGVVKAFCCKCRSPLHLFGASLKCMECGNSEPRKIANGYLLK